MADLTTGRPRVVVNIVDTSVLNANTSATIACVMGATTKGEPYKPTLIKNWQQFTEEFGDLDSTLGFPLQCKRALEAGAQLYVARVAHWASTTWEGTKATAAITQSSNTITFTAKYVGKGYNGIVLTVRAAISGDATKVDIIETQGRISTVIRDITKTTVSGELATINAKLRFTVVNSLPTTMPIGTATTASGAQTLGSIVDADYIGSRSTETKGWFCFDSILDSMRIANLDRAEISVDEALVNYCIERGDMRAFITTDTASGYAEFIAYRNSGNVMNTYFADLVAGYITIVSPYDSTQKLDIPAIGDVLGLMCSKDSTKGVWYSTAGVQRGTLKNVLGVPYNLDLPVNADAYDQVYDKQINPVVFDGVQVLYKGNRTLLTDQTKVLRKSHAADLTIYIKRVLTPILKSYQFEPQTPETWNSLYRKAKTFIETLEAGSAIEKGEGIGWEWIGDQNAKDRTDVSYNQTADLDQDIYRVKFVFKPISLMEKIELELNVTNSSISAQVV